MVTKEARQRYRLQARFKRLGLRYNSRERTVYVPEGSTLDEQKKKNTSIKCYKATTAT